VARTGDRARLGYVPNATYPQVADFLANDRAQKGELRISLPIGFVYDDDKIVFDPVQEVQGAVRAVFELFEQENSAYRVVQRFHQLGLRFTRRAYSGAWDGKLIWGRLTHARVIGVLANPCYAGTYVFGRYQSCKKIDATDEICTHSRRMPEDQWRVVIPVISLAINSAPIASA
jgi:hypothetical protein